MGYNSGFKGLNRQGRQFSRLLAAEFFFHQQIFFVLVLDSALKISAMRPPATLVPARQTAVVRILTVMTNPNFVLSKKKTKYCRY